MTEVHPEEAESARLSAELQPDSEWGQFANAMRTFAGDYHIVDHPDTPFVAPFDHPNVPDNQGHRQYSVTQIPVEMTEEEFLRQLGEADTLFVGCMDPDAIGPAYDLLQAGGARLAVISMAGGMVQPPNERSQALETILSYLGKHGGNITRVVATGHDHGCGLVKVATNGKPLPENLGVAPASEGEDRAMKELIQHGVVTHKLGEKFPRAKVEAGLVQIDRQGTAAIDTNFQGISPKSLVDIVPPSPQA